MHVHEIRQKSQKFLHIYTIKWKTELTRYTTARRKLCEETLRQIGVHAQVPRGARAPVPTAGDARAKTPIFHTPSHLTYTITLLNFFSKY